MSSAMSLPCNASQQATYGREDCGTTRCESIFGGGNGSADVVVGSLSKKVSKGSVPDLKLAAKARNETHLGRLGRVYAFDEGKMRPARVALEERHVLHIGLLLQP